MKNLNPQRIANQSNGQVGFRPWKLDQVETLASCRSRFSLGKTVRCESWSDRISVSQRSLQTVKFGKQESRLSRIKIGISIPYMTNGLLGQHTLISLNSQTLLIRSGLRRVPCFSPIQETIDHCLDGGYDPIFCKIGRLWFLTFTAKSE